jgi:hypothetical protein
VAHPSVRVRLVSAAALSAALAWTLSGTPAHTQSARAQDLKLRSYKGQPIRSLLSSGGRLAVFGAGTVDPPPVDENGKPIEPPGTDDGLTDDPGVDLGNASMFGGNNPNSAAHDNGRGGNTFVNDPCLDPPHRCDSARCRARRRSPC